MYKYSDFSLENLASVHPELKKLFYRVLLHRDHRILCGHRGEEDQNRAYNTGKSTLSWPNSKHNTFPSIAIDVEPYPPPTGARAMWEWANWVGFVQAIAAELGIKVKNGMDWDQDLDLDDTSFVDAYHFELVELPSIDSVLVPDHTSEIEEAED